VCPTIELSICFLHVYVSIGSPIIVVAISAGVSHEQYGVGGRSALYVLIVYVGLNDYIML